MDDAFFTDEKAVETDTRAIMSDKGVIWDGEPRWFEYPNSPSGTHKVFQGRMVHPETGKSEFIDSDESELAFWIAARNVALDTDWGAY